jgi:hypothetical protein
MSSTIFLWFGCRFLSELNCKNFPKFWSSIWLSFRCSQLWIGIGDVKPGN